MLDPPLKSEVLKQPFFDLLAGQFQLDPFGDHGIEHWLRVLINGREIAKCINVNLKSLNYLRFSMTAGGGMSLRTLYTVKELLNFATF